MAGRKRDEIVKVLPDEVVRRLAHLPVEPSSTGGLRRSGLPQAGA